MSGLKANCVRLDEASNKSTNEKRDWIASFKKRMHEDWDRQLSELEAMALAERKKRQADVVRG